MLGARSAGLACAARLATCALAIAACSPSASRLDSTTQGAVPGRASGADPWSAPSQPSDLSAEADGDAFDLRASLAKVAETIAKPGPYEAPEHAEGYDAGKPHWGVLALGGEIVERQTLSWTGGSGTELRALIDRLRELASDAKLIGVIVRAEQLELSLPDAFELRAAMHDVRRAGKQLACHAEGVANTAYLVLAACDRIALAPLGNVVITGPAAMPIHVKGLLDKLGVQADFLHVGAYKGAAEPLTLDAPSQEMRETLGAILDRRYQTMVDVIAAERKLPPASVKALIDTALFPADQARAAQLVDDVAGFETFRDEVARGTPWTRLELDPDKTNQLAMIMKLSRFLGALPPDRPTGGHVAVVYALGDIVDGSGDGVLGARQQIASHTLVAALRALTADDTVKAVVLRIDSGGGSALASELIWRAVADLKASKPVIVSMSDVAASGGYYIASGATKIYALADTLTGSIGVVGGKLAPRDALAKLGVTTFPIGRGKRATMTASLGPWTDDERATVRTAMDAVYQVFIGRVAAGRGKPAAAVHAIAQGRVWTGEKAKALGLVDELGGLDAALAEAQRLAAVDAKAPLEIYPPTPTLRDVFAGFGEVHAPFGLAADTILATLGAIDPGVAAATENLLRLVLSFRTSMIQAVALLPVLP
jgi:protease IV